MFFPRCVLTSPPTPLLDVLNGHVAETTATSSRPLRFRYQCCHEKRVHASWIAAWIAVDSPSAERPRGGQSGAVRR
eukprot:scaffold80056_cov30-Tisochrysis_lutea.AAC.1